MVTFVPPKDRTLEHSTSNSQTVFTVTGALDTSFNAFSAAMSVGDWTFGFVAEPGTAFKSGKLTYSNTNEITIDSIFGESKGTFSSGGTKEVGMGLPGRRLAALTNPLLKVIDLSVAAIDITSIGPEFDDYLIRLSKIVLATANAALMLQVSQDGGSTYKTTGYISTVGGLGGNPHTVSNTGWAAEDHTGGLYLTGDNSILDGVSAGADLGICGQVILHSPGGINRKQISGQVSYPSNTSARIDLVMVGGYYDSNTAVNAFRLQPTTGGFTSGKAYVHGLTKQTAF